MNPHPPTVFDTTAPGPQNWAVGSRGVTNAVLIERAAAGDDDSWRAIVDAHTGLVWSIIRTYAIGPDAQDDVFQTVWLRLAENLTRIQDAERLASWLARVARNEATSIYRKRSRVVPQDDVGIEVESAEPELDHRMTVAFEQGAVRTALDKISAPCRRLLTMLVVVPKLSYDEIGQLLDMPVGSIGPTRSRCLGQLRQTSEIQGLSS